MRSLIQAGKAVGQLPSAKKTKLPAHQPDQTLLYQSVQQHYPAFLEHQTAARR